MALFLAAVLKMKQSKMLEKELNKVEGMQILLMQQKMGLEGTLLFTKRGYFRFQRVLDAQEWK